MASSAYVEKSERPSTVKRGKKTYVFARLPFFQLLIPILVTSSSAQEDYKSCHGTGWKAYLTGKTYSAARSRCQSDNAALATVRSAADRACVEELLSKVETVHWYFWIGLTDAETEGRFVWESDGLVERADSGNWLADQPETGTASGAQDCGYASRDGKLGDAKCDYSWSFVCQTFTSQNTETVQSKATSKPASPLTLWQAFQPTSGPASSQQTNLSISPTPSEYSNSTVSLQLTNSTTSSFQQTTNSTGKPSSTSPVASQSQATDEGPEKKCSSSSPCSGLSTAGVVVTALAVCVISSLATSLVCVSLGIHRYPEYASSLRSGASSRADQRSSILTRSDVGVVDLQRPLPQTPNIRMAWPKQTAAYKVVVLHNPVCCTPNQDTSQRPESPKYVEFSQS